MPRFQTRCRGGCRDDPSRALGDDTEALASLPRGLTRCRGSCRVDPSRQSGAISGSGQRPRQTADLDGFVVQPHAKRAQRRARSAAHEAAKSAVQLATAAGPDGLGVGAGASDDLAGDASATAVPTDAHAAEARVKELESVLPGARAALGENFDGALLAAKTALAEARASKQAAKPVEHRLRDANAVLAKKTAKLDRTQSAIDSVQEKISAAQAELESLLRTKVEDEQAIAVAQTTLRAVERDIAAKVPPPAASAGGECLDLFRGASLQLATLPVAFEKGNMDAAFASMQHQMAIALAKLEAVFPGGSGSPIACGASSLDGAVQPGTDAIPGSSPVASDVAPTSGGRTDGSGSPRRDTPSAGASASASLPCGIVNGTGGAAKRGGADLAGTPGAKAKSAP